MQLTSQWQSAVGHLRFALQPIVNIRTGDVYGFEALLRGVKDAGFETIAQVFDDASRQGTLFALDLSLREIALQSFIATGIHQTTRLFYNVDTRLLRSPDFSPDFVPDVMEKYNLSPSSIFLEISERHEFESYTPVAEMVRVHKRELFRIAIDDFGSGYAGLQLLYHSEPDLVKIDRFFIEGIDQDSRKKLFVSHVVQMAHIMNILVVAEGVETAEEFNVCKEIGCDLVQGFLIQRPTEDVHALHSRYDVVRELIGEERRQRDTTEEQITRRLDTVTPVRVDTEMVDVLSLFRKQIERPFFPVVSAMGEPLGIIREHELKAFVYSPFGISILKNPSFNHDMRQFVISTPVADIRTPLYQILAIYDAELDADAIIITENGRYVGVLDSRQLLGLVNEQEISRAREQNPLTRLPGNNMVSDYVTDHTNQGDGKHLFIYFDFNDFKPFNDAYGFRQGDRVILLFADMLRVINREHGVFVAHIGGDDFFVACDLSRLNFNQGVEMVRTLVRDFGENCRSFYSAEDRERGFIESTRRSGRPARFPLLTISAAMLEIDCSHGTWNPDRIGKILAKVKSASKRAPSQIALLRSPGDSDALFPTARQDPVRPL